MRDIRFRAFVNDIMGNPFDPFDPVFMSQGGTFPEGTIFMQYTGLHDKNGKEIFEGDVVKVISGGSDHWTRERFTVYYSEDTASFKIKNNKSYPHDIDDQISYKYLEVIGNIHENPH